MTAPVLSVENLTVALPGRGDRRHAVDNVSFALDANEILCLVGESGSGKSMTAHTVLGLLPRGVHAASGTIAFEGQNLLSLDEPALQAIRGRRIAMIFQEPLSALNPLMTVGDQLDELLRRHTTLDQSASERRIIELFGSVGLPDPQTIGAVYPFRLSGGQRQRVMIAMMLALEPAVLIADEPTTALDVTTQAQILSLIRELQAKHGMAVLFITHDFGVVSEIAHRVAVMQSGRIVETGPSAEILNRPQQIYTRHLLAAVPALTPPSRPALETPPYAEIRSLRKTYRTGGGLFSAPRVVEAVRDVSLTIRRGETLGLVGESGSGKSTVGRLLVRLLEPDGGSIIIGGNEIGRLRGNALRGMRRRVQMVFQDPFASLNPRRKVGDIIADGPLTQGQAAAPVAARVRELLQLVGLDAGAMDRYPHEFSGGQRQRIAIARALALEPEFLVADEPVSALDVSVQEQILRLLDDLRRRLSLTMLFITHDLRVAAQVCDRIAIMQRGAIVETGPTADVYAVPTHPYTKELLAAVPGRSWTPPQLATGTDEV